MPWWEEVLDFVSLSRWQINSFLISIGVVGEIVLGVFFRGSGMIAAMICLAIGVVLAILSMALRHQQRRSWLLCLLGLVIAVAGTIISLKFLGAHGK